MPGTETVKTHDSSGPGTESMEDNVKRHAVLAIAVAISVLGVLSQSPIAQDPTYHLMADRRSLFGIPNGLNVLSSLAFAIVGATGLSAVFSREAGGTAFPDRWLRWPYAAVFAGALLTAFGSAYYHLAPDNARLVWDRLPMTVGFMGLLTAVLADRVSVRLARILFIPVFAIGAGSVGYWYLTEVRGVGDLRMYALVEFGALLIVVLLLLLYPARERGTGYLVTGLATYAAAKCFEMTDAPVLAPLTSKPRAKSCCQTGGREGCDRRGEDVHRVVRAEDEHGRAFEEGNYRGGARDPPGSDLRHLNRTQYGDGRVAGEEEIIGHVVGDQQGREAGLPPDHARRRGQCARELGDLPEHEEQQQANPRPQRRSEQRGPEQEQAEQIDEPGSGDEQRVRRAGVSRQPAVQRRGPVVHRITDRALTQSPRPDQRLRSEPCPQTHRNRQEAKYKPRGRFRKKGYPLRLVSQCQPPHAYRNPRQQCDEHESLRTPPHLAPSCGRPTRSPSNMVSSCCRTCVIIESPCVPRSRPGSTSMASKELWED